MPEQEVDGPCPKCQNPKLIQEYDGPENIVTGNSCNKCGWSQTVKIPS